MMTSGETTPVYYGTKEHKDEQNIEIHEVRRVFPSYLACKMGARF